jgi:hypothetical protein
VRLWSEGGRRGAFEAARGDAPHLEAVERLKDWTRARFALGEGDTVMVLESAVTLPGCPALETTVAFWTGGGTLRHHFKVFKGVVSVTEADLPPSWLREALAYTEGIECACC